MGANTQEAIKKYRRNAADYDRKVAITKSVRERAIAWLQLTPGQTVLDVGCGTGLSFPLLENQIGERGHLMGIELSSDMLLRAEARVRREGWGNVTLIRARADEWIAPRPADAILLHFTHDVLQSKPALENILRQARPGATVVAAGVKWLPWWLMPLNIVLYFRIKAYLTTREGLGRPWAVLEEFLDDFRLQTALGGASYLVSGRVKAAKAAGRRTDTATDAPDRSG